MYKSFALLLCCILLLPSLASADGPYEPTWESLDSRPTPEWWTDAKFGIFIHWGLYSVPAYSKVGAYSEWYWENLVNPGRKAAGHELTKAFHNRVYGEGFVYADFAPLFRCEMFDPAEWAELFEDAGAKYVVLTSKHHDGYCLWNSDQADKSWGRPWNSVETGPQRDLVGDLTKAVRETDVRMGLYYSLYEWRNPLYVADPQMYVDKVMVPQLKDVITKYSPEIIFSDGEWDHPDELWRSRELLAWMYNQSPSKDSIVVNDRWGKKLRHKHGGYYTTEYGSGLPNADHPWEENRGMAHSFGFSRTENLKDYNSTQQLLYMLIDIVSRGGNFLLDIGPTADGRVPVIMQERLLEMGDWLRVNGEAIYGTHTWDKTCQWSDGQRQDAQRGQYKVKYDVMKLTVDPDEGAAVKQAFFTRKGNALYAICPQLPDDGKLRLAGVKLASGATVTMLGREGSLQTEQQGDDLVITLPKLNPSKMPCEFAWTFKMDRVQ